MREHHFRTWVAVAAAVLALVGSAGRANAQGDAGWLEPFPPFKIAGNLYYVGSKGLANYLIATPEGHILINSDLEANVPLIRASVGDLGFKFTDIKVLLISHAHWDHAAGSDAIKSLTGAGHGDGGRRVGRSGWARPTSTTAPIPRPATCRRRWTA